MLFEDQAPPEPENVLGWVLDEDTKDEPAAAYAQALLKQEAWRLAHRVQGYERHEALVDMKFIDFETRHATGHFQTSAAEAVEVARLWERLAGILRKQCGREFLPIRPTHLRMVVCENEPRYLAYLKHFRATGHTEEDDADWWKLAQQSASFGARNLTLIRRDRLVPPRGAGLPHMAVFSFARMLMRDLSDNKAPAWFAEGFSSLCETLVLDRPLCYSIRYEYNPLTFEADWGKAVAQGLKAGKARSWELVFPLELIGMSQLDYQQCWSIVRFLFETDGAAFARLPSLFRQGLTSEEALQRAFGKPLKDLERAWTRRAQTGR